MFRRAQIILCSLLEQGERRVTKLLEEKKEELDRVSESWSGSLLLSDRLL